MTKKCPYLGKCKQSARVAYPNGFFCSGVRTAKIKGIPKCDKVIVCVGRDGRRTEIQALTFEEGIAMSTCMHDAVMDMLFGSRRKVSEYYA